MTDPGSQSKKFGQLVERRRFNKNTFVQYYKNARLMLKCVVDHFFSTTSPEMTRYIRDEKHGGRTISI